METLIEGLGEAVVKNLWILVIVAVALIFCIAAFAEERRKSIAIRERERTRREIAAYIAEGSMTPEDGARLLDAGGRPGPDDA